MAKYANRKEVRSTDNLDMFNKEKDKLQKKHDMHYNQKYSAYRVTINLPEENKRTISQRRDAMETKSLDTSVVVKKSERFMKDFYQTNPLETLSKQKFLDTQKEELKKVESKTNRVTNYLGSNGVKSIFNSDNNVVRKRTYGDKIINRDNNILAHHTANADKTHEYKRFNHYFDGKKGVFMK